MSVSIRRARDDDLEFLLELVQDDDVRPFLGAGSADDHASLLVEIERSVREPHDFGRFVIELEGEPAGGMGFEVVNRRSRIAQLERLAVHRDFRGRHLADEAARAFQRHLVTDLGYHRLQLEIYGFNERAIRHAERSGFVREGARRRAYRRHGGWVDGVLFALLAEEVEGVREDVLLLHDHVGRFNEGVRTGDWTELLELFADGAELAFEGVPAGPFRGRDAIAAAYSEQPPDDQLDVLRVEAGVDVVALYAWRRAPADVAGRMVLTPDGDRIGRLLVTFEEGLTWN